jgi:hypothetical protein
MNTGRSASKGSLVQAKSSCAGGRRHTGHQQCSQAAEYLCMYGGIAHPHSGRCLEGASGSSEQSQHFQLPPSGGPFV